MANANNPIECRDDFEQFDKKQKLRRSYAK